MRVDVDRIRAAGWIGLTIAWSANLRWLLPVLPISGSVAWILVLVTIALSGSNGIMKFIAAMLPGAGLPIAASHRVDGMKS